MATNRDRAVAGGADTVLTMFVKVMQLSAVCKRGLGNDNARVEARKRGA